MTEHDQIERLRREVAGESPTVNDLLMSVLERQDLIFDKLDALETTLSAHSVREESVMKLFIESLPHNPDGSPDGAGHRQFHTTLIEEARERATFYREMRKELIRKGLWGLLWAMGFLVVFWWQTEIAHKHGGG